MKNQESQAHIKKDKKHQVSGTVEPVSVQKLMKEMDELQSKFGGRAPGYINMWLANKTMKITDRIKTLTGVLIALTIIMAVLTVIHIVLLLSTYI